MTDSLTLRQQSSVSQGPTLVLADSGNTHLLKSAHILYVEGLGRYRRVRLTAEGCSAHAAETILSDTTLDEFESQLLGWQFFRVHRSYLVNLAHVTALRQAGRQQEVHLEGVASGIPVARPRVRALKRALDSPNA